jgi:hypothetical protein
MTSSAVHDVQAAQSLLSSIAQSFPETSLAFAYGSGVFAQPGAQKPGAEPPMVDLVFVVEDSYAWHSANLRRHSAHYSALRLLGPGFLARVQELGAGIFYNTSVPWLNAAKVRAGLHRLARIFSCPMRLFALGSESVTDDQVRCDFHGPALRRSDNLE